MSLKIIHTKSGIQIGTVRLVDDKGWYCFPWTSAHKPSRVPHYTADEAIPSWMKKMGIHIEYPPFGTF